jgi:pilus assembly protein CpaF
VTAALTPQVRARLAAAAVADAGALGHRAAVAALVRADAEIAGLGPLTPLVADPATTDVVVNADGTVWTDRGHGLERAGLAPLGREQVRGLATRLAAAAGRRLDESAPWVDAPLPGGVRLHAVLPPVSPEGPCLSLRVSGRRLIELDRLVADGALHPMVADLLRALVSARCSFLVTGGTGSGKTTLLASLLSLVAPGERLVLVEDCAELRPRHPHVVRLEARPANVEGAGAVGLGTLIRQALRMRPDRLVVGEARGPEVVDLLTALNSGQSGAGTMHANRPADLPARVEALAALAGLSRPAAHSLLAAAVSVVVHLTRELSGRRRVSSIAVLGGGPAGRVRATTGYLVPPAGPPEPGPGCAALSDLLGPGGW